MGFAKGSGRTEETVEVIKRQKVIEKPTFKEVVIDKPVYKTIDIVKPNIIKRCGGRKGSYKRSRTGDSDT